MTPAQQVKWIERLEELAGNSQMHPSHRRDATQEHFHSVGIDFYDNDDHDPDGELALRVHDYIVDRHYTVPFGRTTWLHRMANGEALRDLLLHTLLNDGPRAAKDLAQTFDVTDD